jgi:hypothetical protein
MVTARLAGKGVGGREVGVEGLGGGTRVAELLSRAATALEVPANSLVAGRCHSRWLARAATLAEAGVRAGGVVEVYVGEGGGMPGVLPGGVAEAEAVEVETDAGAEAEDDRARRMRGLFGEMSHHVSRMEVHLLAPAPAHLQTHLEAEAAAWRVEEVEAGARRRELERVLAEAQAQLERIRALLPAAPPTGEVRPGAGEGKKEGRGMGRARV